ncbi:Phosphatidate cytidylyltransferase [Candidatus Rhodobacter oscarellae]|uniref:Phosphatidate cytidylyltransferase n=1 Tax=Candidatus Rhodobacter oscarellae TaxID=1675527 RepID=A0A0J9E643_9RHOB|nr:Phosphatidate cytidylyltransferase [Candidatus Rhodobacter lobularis]
MITGGLLIALGITVISMGGMVFALTCAAVTGIMVWELSRMIDDDRASQAIQLGVVTAICLLLARQLPDIYTLPLLLIPAVSGAFLLRKHPWLFAVYAVGITVAGFGLTAFRDTYGVVWLFWLVIVVAMTDIAGYFAGKMIGGAKFWPSISPKKTWAGIIAGWLAAVLVSFVFLAITDAGRDLIWISALLSFASQMGDIAESAVKRRMGVKDSSNLLPGHGGLFDRFDALLGASLFMLLTALIVDVPELQF